MKRKNVLGWALILFGALSLIFAWPWGSLIGAILVLAGVLALKLQPQPHNEQKESQPQPEQPQTPPAQPHTEKSHAEAERMLAKIKDLEKRGEPVPDELIDAGKRLVKSGLEVLVQRLRIPHLKHGRYNS
jgi:hypothetical protein